MTMSNLSTHARPVAGPLIWRSTKPYNGTSVADPNKIRIEFPDLIRFRDAWYCTFREAQTHDNHPSGVGRIIRSTDGVNWTLIKTIQWEGADLSGRLRVTSDGQLMLFTTLLYVSREPREGGGHYQLDLKTLGIGQVPHSDAEKDVASQGVTWLSTDGLTFGTAHTCPTLANTNPFNVTWHNGMGYTVTNALGKDKRGAIHRTRDGKSWRTLIEGFTPENQADEADIAFLPNDDAVILLRGNTQTIAMLGIGKAPYYQDWKWINPLVDWHGDGNSEPINKVLRAVHMGGPRMITLSDGRLLGGGRILGPANADGSIDPDRVDPDDPEGREDGRITLFWIDPHTGVMTKFLQADGTSYAGIVEHDNKIFVTYLGRERDGFHMLSVDLPR